MCFLALKAALTSASVELVLTVLLALCEGGDSLRLAIGKADPQVRLAVLEAIVCCIAPGMQVNSIRIR